MIDAYKRLREPVAWVVLLVIVASMVLAVVTLAMGGPGQESGLGRPQVLGGAMNLTWAALLVAAVGMCLYLVPMTSRVELLARVSAGVVCMGTLFAAAGVVMAMASANGALNVILEALGGLLDIVLKGVAAFVLWLFARTAASGRPEVRDATVAQVEEPEVLVVGEPPTWRPQDAAGTAWKTAADAAVGAQPAAPGSDLSSPAAPIVARPGAAAALGWHRVADSEPPTPESASDTPVRS